MNRKERRVWKKKTRRIGVVFASVALVGATGALGSSAFAGQGSDQCSNGVYSTCEDNSGGYGFSSHYVSGPAEYHCFSTYQHSGRDDGYCP